MNYNMYKYFSQYNILHNLLKLFRITQRKEKILFYVKPFYNSGYNI